MFFAENLQRVLYCEYEGPINSDVLPPFPALNLNFLVPQVIHPDLAWADMLDEDGTLIPRFEEVKNELLGRNGIFQQLL